MSPYNVNLVTVKASDGQHNNQYRAKRATIEKITPISATVEVAMVIDYSVWLHISSNSEFMAKDETDQAVNVLLYFAQIGQVVCLRLSVLSFVLSTVCHRKCVLSLR